MSLTPLQHNPLQKEAQHLLLFWLYSYIKARLPRIYDSIYYCFITIIMHQSHCEHSNLLQVVTEMVTVFKATFLMQQGCKFIQSVIWMSFLILQLVK